MFGVHMEKKFGIYSYKISKDTRKKPGLMSLGKKNAWLKQGYQGKLKIKEQERTTDRLFGQFTKNNRKRRFLFDIEKVPFYNIPDLANFNLKAYVPHTTP
mmetsp:Transcript_4706/g.3221  ORF Transcript_4706/g.3221 Transcript_4706/m.3221 type:complete len:100 (+) Transcript_4706:136-435(+)